MDLLTRMATFVRIVETGSLSAAARRLRLSLPAVSRQLRALEDELGAPLFRRTARGVALLPTGERFLARARAILSDVDRAVAEVRDVAVAQVRSGPTDAR